MFRATPVIFRAFLSNVLTTGSGRREEIWRAVTSQADAPSAVTLNAEDRPAASGQAPWGIWGKLKGVTQWQEGYYVSQDIIYKHWMKNNNAIIVNKCTTPNMYCNWGYKAYVTHVEWIMAI